MAAVIALRRFGYAGDALGLTTLYVEPGQEFDLPDDMVPSLMAEGYVAPAGRMADTMAPPLETKPEPAPLATQDPEGLVTPAAEPLETKPAPRRRKA